MSCFLVSPWLRIQIQDSHLKFRCFYAAGTIMAISAACGLTNSRGVAMVSEKSADAHSGSAGFAAWQQASENLVDAVSAVLCNHLDEETLTAGAKATDSWAADTGTHVPAPVRARVISICGLQFVACCRC